MPLPAIDCLTAAGFEFWKALGARWRAIGLTAEAARPFTKIGERLAEPLRGPMRRWHLRQTAGLPELAMRLLMFADPIAPEEAAAVAGGEGPLEQWLARGLLKRSAEGRITCPFLLNIVGGLFILCDDLTHGGEAVMGAGATTGDLCNAAFPTRPVGRILDLGCGAGTVGLVLARRAQEVIGTDINPRALAFSRINAALNDITNIEFRLGDGFAPVAGEQFDLVVSQPPFVAKPRGSADATFLYGGDRGDELTLQLFGQVSPFIAAGGRALFLVDWPETDGDPIPARLAQVLPPAGQDRLLLLAPATDLDSYCAAYASKECPTLGPAFEERAMIRRQHMKDFQIEGLRLSLVVLRPVADRPGRTAVIETRPFTEVAPGSLRIDRLLATQDLLASGDDLLAQAPLACPEGILFRENEDGVLAQLPDDALVPPIKLNRPAAALISMVHDAGNAAEAVARYAASAEIDPAEARRRLFPSIRQALEAGLLEPSNILLPS